MLYPNVRYTIVKIIEVVNVVQTRKLEVSTSSLEGSKIGYSGLLDAAENPGTRLAGGTKGR